MNAFRLFAIAAALAVMAAPAWANCSTGEVAVRLGTAKLDNRATLKVSIGIVKERFDRALQGRFCLQIVEDDVAFAEGSALTSLRDGTADMALESMAGLARLVPVAQAYELPFAFRNDRAPSTYGTATLPSLRADLTKAGAVLSAVLDGPRIQFGLRKPLVEPTDLAGAKVAALGRAFNARQRLRPFDAVALQEPEATLAEALKAGRVDAVEAGFSQLQKLAEAGAITHALESNHLVESAALLASAKWWGTLEPAVQREMQGVFTDAAQQAGFRVDNAERNARNRAIAAGLDLRILTDGQRTRWTTRLRDAWDDFRAANDAATLTALERANADF